MHASNAKRVAIYVRVSTTDQTTLNQERELRAVADRHWWDVVAVYEDRGISGANGRERRAGLAAMMKAVARREIDMVAAWSVDRLGRSLTDLLGILTDVQAKGVDLFLHQQGLDTTTPSGRAMFQMLGVFAEFERAIIRERVIAGLARARDEGTALGRPLLEKTNTEKVEAIRAMLRNGTGVRRIARELHVGVGTVLRIKENHKSATIPHEVA
jgi:DNA invertase Pin-like site-specific DNA recombinase